jgi:hypothetical protein
MNFNELTVSPSKSETRAMVATTRLPGATFPENTFSTASEAKALYKR